MYSFLRIFIYIINNASKNSKLAGAVHVYMSINKQHFIILHDRISDSRQQLLYKYIYFNIKRLPKIIIMYELDLCNSYMI